MFGFQRPSISDPGLFSFRRIRLPVSIKNMRFSRTMTRLITPLVEKE
jgi:hypothetical protein